MMGAGVESRAEGAAMQVPLNVAISLSTQWARSIPIPIPGAASLGATILVAGQPPQAPWQTRHYFRVLESAQPTLFDFWCYAKVGRALARIPSEATITSYGGLSVYTTLAAAGAAAQKFGLGTHIAELDVPDNGWFGISEPVHGGHVTIVGDGEHLSRFLRQIHPV
jgi:hypothetical protein